MVSELLGKMVVQATRKSSESKPDWAKALAVQEQITNICANWEQRALSGQPEHYIPGCKRYTQ